MDDNVIIIISYRRNYKFVGENYFIIIIVIYLVWSKIEKAITKLFDLNLIGIKKSLKHC